MRHLPVIVSLVFATFCVAAFVGCDGAADSAISVGLDDATLQFERARLLLTAEPADAMTPTDAKDVATVPKEIVLAGRIDAGEFDPFQSGKATLMLSELPDQDHANGDPNHGENCKFCARRLANAPKVIVSFNDADGKLLEIGAKELFNVSKGDAVVVKGKGHFQEATGTVTVNASGLFKRDAS